MQVLVTRQESRLCSPFQTKFFEGRNEVDRAKRELRTRLTARIPRSLRSPPPSLAKGASYFDTRLIIQT